jgi:phosphonate transport system substrate-binding protein
VKPLTFGYAIRDARATTRSALSDFTAHIAALANVEIGLEAFSSYDELTQSIHRGASDVAWVPPLPLVALVRARRVTPVATLHRDQLVHYRSAVVVASGSRIMSVAELGGMRAAWVDPHSAAGYVLARVELARRGVGPRALGLETFFGSHDAVVQAVATKRADFGATFARIARDGVVEGPWAEGGLRNSIRAVGTFGEIPPDALVFRSELDAEARRALGSAFVAVMANDSGRALVKRAFGADALRRFEDTLYETFRDAVFRAYEDGVLDASDALRSLASDADATTQRPSIVPGAAETLPELPQSDD